MNKQDLINSIETKLTSGESKACIQRVLDSTLLSITESLGAGEPVLLVGFGTFTVSNRKARSGRNPQTGAVIAIPAKKAVRFKVGKNLASAV